MARLYRRPARPGGTYYIDTYEDGRRIRKSLETDVLKVAKARRDAYLAGELTARWGAASAADLTPTAFWEWYGAWAPGHKAQSSVNREKYDFDAFVDHVKPKTLGAVRTGHIDAFKRHALRELEWSPRTVNDCFVRLGALYNIATAQGIYSGPNPFVGFKRLKTETRQVRFLDVEQLEAVMTAAREHVPEIHLFCALCAYAGLRASEAVAAEWSWVNFKRDTLKVHPGKSGREREIPLHSRLRAILEPLRQSAGYIINPEKTAPGQWRLRYEPKRAFNTVLKRASTALATAATERGETTADTDITWATPHTLRHTFASLLVQSGVSLYKVQQWLGHRDPRTSQIYAHLAPQDSDIERL